MNKRIATLLNILVGVSLVTAAVMLVSEVVGWASDPLYEPNFSDLGFVLVMCATTCLYWFQYRKPNTAGQEPNQA